MIVTTEELANTGKSASELLPEDVSNPFLMPYSEKRPAIIARRMAGGYPPEHEKTGGFLWIEPASDTPMFRFHTEARTALVQKWATDNNLKHVELRCQKEREAEREAEKLAEEKRIKEEAEERARAKKASNRASWFDRTRDAWKRNKGKFGAKA